MDKPKPKIMLGVYDVTEHVAAMYDAIVGSMDWGSGFLSAEEQCSILIIGKLAGWDLPDPNSDVKGEWLVGPKPLWQADYPAYQKALKEWQKQVFAAIEAKALDCFNEQSCESVGVELLSKVTTPRK